MNELKSFGLMVVKVAAAYALIAAVQKHVFALPVVGAYLPGAKATT